MEIREFLERLCCGIKEIPKKHHSLFYALQKLDVISKKEKTFHLKEGYAIGSLDVVREDLIFLKSFSPRHSKDFRLLRVHKGIVSGDIALVKTISKSTRARLVSLLYTPSVHTLAYLEKLKGKICALELKSNQDKPLIIPLKARQKALSSLPPHTVLKVDVRNGEILEVLGVLEDEKIDESIVLQTYNRSEEFSAESLELAKSFGDEVYPSLYPKRKDLLSLPFCTIDPSDAKDHDDAIYFDCKNSVLYVGIADVSEYVSKDSSLDKEAKARGFSVYFPHKSIPMLPRALSENICSLNENAVRLALVWEIKLDNNGEILHSEVYEALLKNYCNLTYEQVDEFLNTKKTQKIPKNIQESILGFYPLAQKIRERRLKKGYTFLGDEVRLRLDENQSLKEVRLSSEGESHCIVEEAMLLANIQSAKILQDLEANGIYRIHEEMKEEKLFELLVHLRALGFQTSAKGKNIHQVIEEIQKWSAKEGIEKEVDKMIIKAQNQAIYSSENIGHFGLGFEVYTHFTSPIRRYSDLCVHRLIKDNLEGGKRLKYLSEEYPSLAKSLSESEKIATKMEIEYKDRKFAHWANSHIGEELDAIVVDEQYPPLLQAQEKIVGARVVCKDKIQVEKFEKLRVEIVSANIANAKIYVRVIEGVK